MTLQRTEQKKGLGLFTLVGLSAGQVIGAGVVTLTGVAIGITGRSAWLAYSAAVLMGFCIIFPYMILSSMIRVKGGSYTFVSTLLGETWGGLYGMIFSMNSFATGMIGLGFGTYFVALFPGTDIRTVSVITITIFYFFNILGVNFMAKIQTILSMVLISSLLLFIFSGVGRLDPAVFEFTSPEFITDGSKGFIASMIVLVFSCYGHSFVVAFSKEAKTPKRDIPYAMLITTGIILLIYTSVALVAAGVLPLTDVKGKPLTAVAMEIMPLPVYYAFVIGGPLMAIATTLNSSFTVFSRPFHQMAYDGWFPKKLAYTNRFGAPVIIISIIYLIAVIPIISGLSIQVITTNTVLLGRIADLVAITAVLTLPKKLPDAWENRYFQGMSKKVFYALISFSLAVTILCIALSLNTITKTNVIVTVSVAAFFLLYSVLRQRTGKVQIVKSYELQ
jgi:APA family basic amino acid/polyamine antiporter